MPSVTADDHLDAGPGGLGEGGAGAARRHELDGDVRAGGRHGGGHVGEHRHAGDRLTALLGDVPATTAVPAASMRCV